MGHLGELEQLILFAVTALGDDAYGGAIRAHIEERSREVETYCPGPPSAR